MITCPLCHKEVLEWRSDGYPGKPLPDNSRASFICPTTERLFAGHSSSHFTRMSRIYFDQTQYILMAPPFQVCWLYGSKLLTIYDNTLASKMSIPVVPFHKQEKVEWPEVLHWAERLRNLKAFL